MSLYPTEDGFEDEREEPNNKDYSFDGMCPLCGCEIYVVEREMRECTVAQQYCPNEDCGWYSNELIDC